MSKRSKAPVGDDLLRMRKYSRQAYLQKRVDRKLLEIQDDVIDNEYIFEGVRLTEAEERELQLKKQIHDLANKCQEKMKDNEYRIPEAYDHDGGVNQVKRFSAAAQHYNDLAAGEKMNPFAEQEAWEEYQIGKAKIKFGSKNRKQEADEFEHVFDDGHGVDFIKASVMNEDKKHEDLSGQSVLKKIQEDKKTLPICHYQEELLKAIHDYQVIIIVGETGSGKTTQIPQYLHKAGYTKRGKVGCTQPRRVAAMSVSARVSQEMGVKLGHEVGYSIRFEDCTSDKTVIKYMTDGMLLHEFLVEPDLASYSVIMIDEAHERTLSTDILFGLVKDLCCHRKDDFRLLISSATLDAEKFSNYFDFAPIFRIPGRRYPVQINYTRAPEADYIDAAIATVLQIHVTQPPGDILVFLTGQEEIETMDEIIKRRTKGLGTKVAELIICPLYANLPTELQGNVFKPTPGGVRKVVLATNIAETSLTIDGIKYVVDTGFNKIKLYSPRMSIESLLINPISKASANQRAGRAGRTGPGKCFRLYTTCAYSEMAADNMPEIQRSNLANVVLTLRKLNIEDLVHFDYMDPPPLEALYNAFEQLFALGALNGKGELTAVGRQMAEFPLDPMLSKMIVASVKYKCSDEVISIASMLSVGSSIFYRPKDKAVHADRARLNFYAANGGDHIAFLNVYNSWRETNFSTQWCYENYIQSRSMKRARDVRDQLEGLLKRAGIEATSNANDLDAVKKAITAGYFLHVARLHKGGQYKTVTNSQAVHIHPSSGLAKELPRWVIFHELVLTTKRYIRQVTELKPAWLIEIAPHYYQLKDVEDSVTKKLPRGKGLSAVK